MIENPSGSNSVYLPLYLLSFSRSWSLLKHSRTKKRSRSREEGLRDKGYRYGNKHGRAEESGSMQFGSSKCEEGLLYRQVALFPNYIAPHPSTHRILHQAKSAPQIYISRELRSLGLSDATIPTPQDAEHKAVS